MNDMWKKKHSKSVTVKNTMRFCLIGMVLSKREKWRKSILLHCWHKYKTVKSMWKNTDVPKNNITIWSIDTILGIYPIQVNLGFQDKSAGSSSL